MEKVKTRKRKIFDKRVRCIVSIIFLILLGFRVTMVKAGSNDSIMKKNRVDGIYAVTKIMGVSRIFYLNMYTLNEKISYCIELGVDITSDIYNSTDDFSVSNLTDEQILYIQNVSYFGYGYNNHNDVFYYMATQEIIWEYLNDVDIEWTNVMDANGERINIDTYKNEIINLVDNYYKRISMEGFIKDMEVNIGEEIVITDINYNLKYYDVICEHCDSNIVDNKLYLKFHTDYVGRERVILKRKEFYDYDSNLYYQGASQKLISNGNIKEEIGLEFMIMGKDIHIKLRDSIDIKPNNQFGYADIRYEFYDNEGDFVGFIYSNFEGEIVVENMPYGSYKIRESMMNVAYSFNFTTHYFDFYDDEVIYIDVEPIVNTIKILKYYGEGDDLKKEKGVVFDLYNENGTFYDSFVTNDKGVAEIRVPSGIYLVKQKNSSYGYKRVEDFEVNAVFYSRQPIKYTLVDEAIKFNLFINSKDIDGNFIVEDGISYRIKYEDKYLEFDGKSIFENIDGVVENLKGFYYGDYVIEIINDSNNYVSDVDSLEVKIGDGSNFILKDGELSLEVDVIYNIKKGNLKVKTIKEEVNYRDNSFSYSYVDNEDVEVSLVADRDIVVNNNIVYKKGDVIEKIITDSKGDYLLDDLYLGNYCLIDKDGNKNCFEVVDKEEILVKISSDLKKGSVNVLNISSDLENIMGTVMEFTNSDGKIIHVGATNEDGIIKINDLVYGEYCFSQKSINNKYILNDDSVCFSIDSGDVVNVEVVNKKASKRLIIVPNTFSDKKDLRKLIVLLSILVGGIIYKIKISNKSC